MRNRKILFRLFGLAMFSVAMLSCIEDITNDPHYAIPETLSFTTFNF